MSASPDTIVLVHGFWVTLTENVEFGGKPHLLPAAPGWEEIADYVLAWAVRNAKG